MEKVNDLKGKHNELSLYKEAYTYWNAMHDRVRNKSHYGNVSICDEWYKFSNFYHWMESTEYNEGWHLDKDIMGRNIYSPDTCLFVPQEVNQLFRNVKTKYNTGVVKNGNGYQAQGCFNKQLYKFGTYPTIEEAHYAYVVSRKQYIGQLAMKYSNFTKLSSVLFKLSK